MSDDPGSRRDPPHTDSDWIYMWSGAGKAHKAWVIVGPISAAVTNWKAWVIIAGIVGFIRGPDLLAILLPWLTSLGAP
ncbi:MAG: hypothetical protein VKL39_07080 [Leptolyngbyaceae bacterium]|nr:hypothetical protein [Leptolyngbyaceae bacterium]